MSGLCSAEAAPEMVHRRDEKEKRLPFLNGKGCSARSTAEPGAMLCSKQARQRNAMLRWQDGRTLHTRPSPICVKAALRIAPSRWSAGRLAWGHAQSHQHDPKVTRH